MRILNLYSGIGGNRKLWGDEHEITAIELDRATADVYADLYPNDKIVFSDAHEYLLEHYKDFDFIWTSPPCPTHSRARFGLGVCGKGYKYIYPDMNLYQEIIALTHLCRKQKWCVENVIPYYKFLVTPIIIGRHAYWSNFTITHESTSQNSGIAGHTCKGRGEKEFHLKRLNFDERTGLKITRMMLRNCVEPEIGLHILKCAENSDYRIEQMELFRITR